MIHVNGFLKKALSPDNVMMLVILITMIMMMMMIIIPIVVTLVGIVTVISAVHSAKAALPNSGVRLLSIYAMMIMVMTITDSSNTSRDSNRRQSCTVGEGIVT